MNNVTVISQEEQIAIAYRLGFENGRKNRAEDTNFNFNPYDKLDMTLRAVWDSANEQGYEAGVKLWLNIQHLKKAKAVMGWEYSVQRPERPGNWIEFKPV
jgi:hypothetical protein